MEILTPTQFEPNQRAVLILRNAAAAAADAVNHARLIRIVWELATYDRRDDRKPYTQGSAPQSHS